MNKNRVYTKNKCPKCGEKMFEDGYGTNKIIFWFECPKCFHRVSINITKETIYGGKNVIKLN